MSLNPDQILAKAEHRPWSLPESDWIWRQSWYDVGFIHVPVSVDVLAPWVPKRLIIDTFDSRAWLSMVPFRMVDVGRRSIPSVYPMRDFSELKLRTYVTDGKKSGVWFFSLDAHCWPVVFGGRHLVGLPYFWAHQHHRQEGDRLRFFSRRSGDSVSFRSSVLSTGPAFFATPGSFEHWVTERYCLYAIRRGQLLRMEVHHPPWPLRLGKIEHLETNLLSDFVKVDFLNDAVCHMSRGVDVLTYPGVTVRE